MDATILSRQEPYPEENYYNTHLRRMHLRFYLDVFIIGEKLT